MQLHFCYCSYRYWYFDITFKAIRNNMQMSMLHVRLAATAKQPVLTNYLLASILVGWACTHASSVKRWFCYNLSVIRYRPSCSGFTQSSPVYLVRCISLAGFQPIKYACHISVDKSDSSHALELIQHTLTPVRNH